MRPQDEVQHENLNIITVSAVTSLKGVGAQHAELTHLGNE